MTARWLTWLATILLMAGSAYGQTITVPCPPPPPPKLPCPPESMPAPIPAPPIVLPAPPVTPPPVTDVPLPPVTPAPVPSAPNVAPPSPTLEPTPSPTPTPTPSPTPTPTPPAPTTTTPDEGRQSPERGAASAARRSPNLFGDQGIAPAVTGQRSTTTFTLGGFFTESGSAARTIFPIQRNGSNFTFVTPPNTTSFGAPITTNFAAPAGATPLMVGNELRLPLLENAQNTQAFAAAAAQRFGAPAGPGLVYLGPSNTALTSPVVSRAVVQPGSTTGIDDGRGANVATFYNYTALSAPTVPLPGFLVGRTKISEDNNPLPRDRLIMTYDYFSNAALGTGTAVNRYQPGFEKTFLDQNASIEVRLPIAYTLSSDVLVDGLLANSAELGNLRLVFKALAYGGDAFNVAVGVGVALPTADDVRVRLSNNVDLLRIRNQSIVVSPFLGALWTPNERLFAQAFITFNFDTNGNPVDAAPPDGLALRPFGRVNDQTLAQVDGQIGYWLIKPFSRPSSWLNGLATFLELHYNSALNEADVLMVDTLFGRQIQVGQQEHLNELNITGGVLTQLGDNFYLALGVVAPLKKAPDRTFDYQIGLRGTYFFGATARSRNPATAASTF